METLKRQKVEDFKRKQEETYKANDLSKKDREAFKKQQKELLLRFQEEQQKLLDAQIMESILVTISSYIFKTFFEHNKVYFYRSMEILEIFKKLQYFNILFKRDCFFFLESSFFEDFLIFGENNNVVTETSFRRRNNRVPALESLNIAL